MKFSDKVLAAMEGLRVQGHTGPARASTCYAVRDDPESPGQILRTLDHAEVWCDAKQPDCPLCTALILRPGGSSRIIVRPDR